MSEITRGVISMPLHMAMESNLSRAQFHGRAQALLADFDQLKAEVEVLRKEVARFDFIQQDAPSIFENVYGENWLDVVDSYVFPTKALGHD